MRRKLLHWLLTALFLAVLGVRLKQHYSFPHSNGFLLEIGNLTPPDNCEFKIPLVLHVSDDHTLRLNEEPEPRELLRQRLEQILAMRLRPELYIDPDPQVTVQELAKILDLATPSDGSIHLKLVTPANRAQSCVDFRPGPAT